MERPGKGQLRISLTLVEALAVVCCVAGVVALMRLVRVSAVSAMPAATTAVEHAIEEAAELGVGEGEEGEEGDEEPHRDCLLTPLVENEEIRNRWLQLSKLEKLRH